MFTAIYRTSTGGKPDIAILATRNTNLVEALADIDAQTAGDDTREGVTLTIARPKAAALLDKAQHNMRLLRDMDPARFDKAPAFLFNDPILGTVSVTWTERA